MAVSVTKGTAVSGTTHKVRASSLSNDEGSGDTRLIQHVAIYGPNGEPLTSSDTQVAPTAIATVNSSTSTVVVASGAKTGWLIMNVSGGTLYMSFHTTFDSTSGILIFNNSSYQQSGPGTFMGNVYMRSASGSGKEVRVQTW
jgi:hypothetical protein